MTLQESADELVAGCREGRSRANLDRLYAADAVSVEPTATDMPREARGLDAIKAKHDWWETAMEHLGGEVSDPMPHGGDRFAVIFELRAREKASGQEFSMKEVAVYHVADNKIAREEFFYAMPPQ